MGCDRRRLRQLTSSCRENRLNILIYARTWAPSVGGVETITGSLARGLADLSKMESGDPILVTVVTLTPADRMNDSRLPFEVIRCPSFVRFVRLVRSASVIHLAGPALLPLSLAWFFRKPV